MTKAYCKDCKKWIIITERFAPLKEINKSLTLHIVRKMFIKAHHKHIHTNYDVLRKELFDLLKAKGVKNAFASNDAKRFVGGIINMDDKDVPDLFFSFVKQIEEKGKKNIIKCGISFKIDKNKPLTAKEWRGEYES